MCWSRSFSKTAGSGGLTCGWKLTMREPLFFFVLVREFLVSCGAVSKFRKSIGVILPRLKRFALALKRSRSEMDDLVQATCERALTRVRQWDPETRLDSWMFRIMQNLWFNEVRARNVRERYAEVE